MAETNGYLESEIKTLEERFLLRVKAFMQGKLNRVEKIALFAELDLFQELQEAGLTKVVSKLEKDYIGIIESIAKNKTGGITALTLNDLQTLAIIDAESILRSAEAYSLQFKSSLLKGLVGGETEKEIIARLGEVPLRANQTIAAVSTARDQFEAASVGKIFEDEPDTKFKLAGPVDGKTRCECKAVMLTQPKEGYTKKEIDKGAWHKLAMEVCPDYNKRIAEGKQQKYGFVNRGGFSCRHRIEIVE
jgi:hypothetical protein